MSKLGVIAVGDYPTIAGLALAGVPVIETDTREDAVARLTDALRRSDIGVVIAGQATIAALPEVVRQSVAKQSIPVLLSLPDPDWSAGAGSGVDAILDLLQRAIGYRVRLQ